jgi:hypothetical protein
VIPGEAVGRSLPIRDPQPGQTCSERDTGSNSRVKNWRRDDVWHNSSKKM